VSYRALIGGGVLRDEYMSMLIHQRQPDRLLPIVMDLPSASRSEGKFRFDPEFAFQIRLIFPVQIPRA
jgi:hypothetical protein